MMMPLPPLFDTLMITPFADMLTLLLTPLLMPLQRHYCLRCHFIFRRCHYVRHTQRRRIATTQYVTLRRHDTWHG